MKASPNFTSKAKQAQANARLFLAQKLTSMSESEMPRKRHAELTTKRDMRSSRKTKHEHHVPPLNFSHPRKLLYFEIPHPQRIGLHKRKAVRREKDSLLKTKPHIEYLLVRFLNFDILMPGNPASLPSQLVVDMLWNWYLGALW